MPRLIEVAPGLRFFTAEEDIQAGVEWSLRRPVDTAIIHLSGHIEKLETELDGCAALHEPPMPGEVWVVPAGVPYRSAARGRVVHYAELHLDAAMLAGNEQMQPEVLPRAGILDLSLHASLLRLLRLAHAAQPMAQLEAESVGIDTLQRFYAKYRKSPQSRMMPGHLRLDAKEKRLLIEYLREGLSDSLRLATLAALVQRTPHEFLVAFRSAFGETPAQYIINQRLRRARWLLLHSSLDIAGIAFETGFSSHAHLSAAFQRRLGLSPKLYRKRLAVPGA